MRISPIINLRKKIPVLIIICCLIFCTSCEFELFNYNPKITLSNAESITANSAVLAATLTTRDIPLLVAFEYLDNGTWQWIQADSCSANKTSVIKKKITGLIPGKTYQYRVTAYEQIRDSGSLYLIPKVEAKSTKEFTTLASSILTIRKIKSDFNTINVKLEFVPNEANTKVQLDYLVDGNVITLLSEAYSAATEINFKLENLEKNTYYPIKIKTLDKYNLVVDTIFNTCAVSDFDGNTYRIVTIGDQVWLQENFRGTHFANGDPIPNVTDKNEWLSTRTPAYCWYNNDPEIAEEYGGLYNWYAASDPRGLIVGYVTPRLYEFQVLADYLGGSAVAGEKMKEAGYTHWIKPGFHVVEPEFVAANSSGFCGLPGGDRREKFYGLGEVSYFWTITTYTDKPGIFFYAYLVNYYYLMDTYGGRYEFRGLSVRLVKSK